jgi:hypothetical protein
LEERRLLATFTVTTTSDSGNGSLRSAIEQIDLMMEKTNQIDFDITGSGVHTITPVTPLLPLQFPTIIDGTTQPGYIDTPLIELNGASAGMNAVGLFLAGGGSTVRGLVINRFQGAAIALTAGSNLIAGNYIGTNNTGTAALPNGNGVIIASGFNTIGGTDPGDRNVISGNTTSGIPITGQDNLILGNYLGTNAAGTAALGNGIGVVVSGLDNLIGGVTPAARNLIAGSKTEGVSIAGNGNVVQGNYIGTDASGSKALGNANGVVIAGTNNTVGGTVEGAGNLVSGNKSSGILLATNGHIVQGNFIGTNASGTAALPNANGVLITGANNTVGGTQAGALNVISGNTTAGILLSGDGNQVLGNVIGTDRAGTAGVGNGTGIAVTGKDNVIGGVEAGARNVISGNKGEGFILSGINNRVVGNVIGTDVTGLRSLANADGVVISGSGNTVGGKAAGAGNVVAGNTTGGVVVSGKSNQVQGNYIGTDATGSAALANDTGVIITGADNTIGGKTAAVRNVISGNTTGGITITGNGNEVLGNLIGTDAAGTAALPNGTGGGVTLFGSGNTIGGVTARARNIIAGNKGNGVTLGSFALASGNLVVGNFIGLDVTGTAALGNQNGVAISLGSNNTIGGTTPGARNVISGNRSDGVTVIGLSNVVQGNFIGTDRTGMQALGNAQGVVITGGPGNTIGGTAAGAGNVIAGNAGDGILLADSGNLVQGNYIGTDRTGTHALGNVRGVHVSSSGSDSVIGGTTTGAGNVIAGNAGDGILIASDRNQVLGNFIGTDLTATTPLSNAGRGVFISGGSNNTLGGTAAGAGNVIAGNAGDGILIAGSNNLVLGNAIGTDQSGTQPLGNARGVDIASGQNNTLGGAAAGAGNLIAANAGDGILIAGSNNLVLGNTIGTDRSGTQAVGNARGVDIASGSNNIIGGVTAGTGNVIAGNAGDGILIADSGNFVLGNYIGTDASGTRALGNARGVDIASGSNNIIGGVTAGTGNVIAGNAGDGIFIASSNNLVLGNLIGTDVTGAAALGNGGNGVSIRGSGNAVGEAITGAGNTIAFSGNDGVLVDTGTGNSILHNSIFSSGHLGIELINGGNRSQQAPRLTAATSTDDTITIAGSLLSRPNTTFMLEFFVNTVCDPSGFGEGERLLGVAIVKTDSLGIATFTVAFAVAVDPGLFIAATATDPDNNTSSFSPCQVVETAGAPDGNRGRAVTGVAALSLATDFAARSAVPGTDPETTRAAHVILTSDRSPPPDAADAFFSDLSWRSARADQVQGSRFVSAGALPPAGAVLEGFLLETEGDLLGTL